MAAVDDTEAFFPLLIQTATSTSISSISKNLNDRLKANGLAEIDKLLVGSGVWEGRF